MVLASESTPRVRRIFQRIFLAIIAPAAVAFLASPGLHHKTVEAMMTACAGSGVVLSSLSAPMREISEAAYKWTLRLGIVGTGACLGFLARLITG